MKKFQKLMLALFALALIMQSTAFAKGRIEQHEFASKILADAGKQANRSMSVYLPEEYDTSGMAYPVLYLIHGGSVNNNPIDYTDDFAFI